MLDISNNAITGDLNNVDMSALVTGDPDEGPAFESLDISQNLFSGM